MSGVHDDLATVRSWLRDAYSHDTPHAALDRVEAELARLKADQEQWHERRMEQMRYYVARCDKARDELARLREERDAAIKAADGMARAPYGEFQKAWDRAEAAERELARLQEGLRQILEVPEYLRSSDVLGAQAIARALLADTAKDGQ